MTTAREQDHDILIDIPQEAAEELADGGSLIVGGDGWSASLISTHTNGAGQIVWMSRAHGVPVLMLNTEQLLDLVRGREVQAEKFGVRYLIQVSGVDQDDWDYDDKD
jgi:hypothetical protein